ncbi:hypothetical protein G8T75_12780 [Clostridium botulinum D/C]|nr:hypothetical protein [Clostridium botulinum]MCD3240832.1 hypothetical protein [Clostridium botulinum D/C]
MSVKILSSFIKFAKEFDIKINATNLKKFRNLQKGEHVNKCVAGVITR